MGFVKTHPELEIPKRELTATTFTNGRRVTVEFLTDPEVYRGLIPPGLQPVEEPLIIVGIGTWDCNSIGHYEGGSISVAVKRDGIPGGYAVSMWMDTDAAVAFGRDVYGEPKRRADAVQFTRQGNAIRAFIERGGCGSSK